MVRPKTGFNQDKYFRKWLKENPDYMPAYMKQYRKTHPEYCKVAYLQSRVRILTGKNKMLVEMVKKKETSNGMSWALLGIAERVRNAEI